MSPPQSAGAHQGFKDEKGSDRNLARRSDAASIRWTSKSNLERIGSVQAMMEGVRVQALHQLPPVAERAVVINAGTEVVSALAIASALQHLQMPVLVINCTADGISKAFMDALRDQWNFDLIDLPLAPHGITLDRLFQDINVDRLTLLDSDAEVRSADVMKRVRTAFEDDSVYGSGFIHQTEWLDDEANPVRVNGQSVPVLYAERPWIPFATFRTSYVRAALANGASFREVYVPGLTETLVLDRTVTAGRIPAIVHGDTGAEVHGWLTAQELRFDGPPVNDGTDEVNHYHGVSRHALSGNGRNATPLDKIENEVLARLRKEYEPYWTGFAAAIKAAQG